MAGKLIELKEAATQLGITPEKLQEMREAGEIHGYKDGTSWKFKPSEIERVAKELADAGDVDELSFSDSASLSDDDFEQLLNLDDSVDAAEDVDNSSILISEEPVQHDSSSTVIGKDEAKGDESDLKLVDDSKKEGGSDVALEADSASQAGDDELKLADSEDMSDELALSDDLDFESDAGLVLEEDSDLSLAPDSDDDDVLADSGSSEDGALALGPSDSGVKSPSDSGISLEGESSSAELELPEDEDMISLDDAMVASPDDATQLQQDEEFLLSPSDEMLGDESSDSGSQVIALDDSSAFESDSDVGGAEAAEPMLVPDEGDALDVQLEPIDGAVAAAGAVPIGAEAPEAAYSAWNIMALLMVVLLLSVTGMLMADIVRNMWAWNGEIAATGGLAKSIVEALGMK
jgi:excisionase family DNA binding protein